MNRFGSGAAATDEAAPDPNRCETFDLKAVDRITTISYDGPYGSTVQAHSPMRDRPLGEVAERPKAPVC